MKEPDSAFKKKIDRLRELRERSLLGGGKDRIDEQHRKGKLTARERLDLLPASHQAVQLGRPPYAMGTWDAHADFFILAPNDHTVCFLTLLDSRRSSHNHVC